MANRQIKGIRVKSGNLQAEDFDLNISDIVSHVTSPDGTDYILKVDNKGNLYTVPSVESVSPGTKPTSAGLVKFNGEAKLYINEIYCGGQEANEHTVGYCSHNFVELSNLTKGDINLSGLSLQYTINSTDWKVLPLKGIIKAGSTFLIRGAQCSMIDSPTTKIVVDKYDMEWLIDGAPIKFENKISCKFYLTFNLDAYSEANPFDGSGKGAVKSNAIGYVDLVGIDGTGTVDGFEKGAYKAQGGLKATRLFKKYYAMDPVKPATKAITARNNANDWNFVDLSKEDGEVIPSISVYTPRASFEGKNLFYDKTNLDPNRPSTLTCSFGIQATDDGEGATRCFNWLSGNLDDKYLWIRRKGETSWGEPHETFYAGDGRTSWTAKTSDGVCIYDRKVKEYTNNTVLIANKFIMSGITAGQYEYLAGKKNQDGTPNLDGCTPVKSFTVRTKESVQNGFKFVQTSDQQGFNWAEYRIWEAASKTIMDENNDLQFMVNTGDMTQNGNRVGEWLDYFNAEDVRMQDMEEMATIGNNDLSLKDLYEVGKSSDGDSDKLWHENIEFYYTFESDPDNLPIFTGYTGETTYYIPSLYSFNYGKIHFLCMNTEIKSIAEEGEKAYNFGANKYGYFYPQIEAWCERDVNKYKEGKDWVIAYCHEMPFTILTPEAVAGDTIKSERGGSNANTNTPIGKEYWFSEFCQNHNIPLVFGGHKHTQATSYPILENVTYADGVRTVNSMKPIIVVDAESLAEFEGATSLVVNAADGCKYPNTWFNGSTLKSSCERLAELSQFIMADEVPEGKTPVVYAMSQATSYKHTSNKELPSWNLPWLRYYYPASDSGDITAPTVNDHQKFPFYTVWEITPTKITGNVRKVYGAFNDKGKFDINIDGPYTRNGYCATTSTAEGSIGGHDTRIFSINGIASMSNTEAMSDTRVIEISK